MSQGAFRIGLEAMHEALTGVDLEHIVDGKPELATYKYADEVIASWMEQIHNDEHLPSNICMIGDNPASNNIGGNMYGWNTCLAYRRVPGRRERRLESRRLWRSQ